ncbi:MAG: HAD-IIB family hydrolase [Desulfobacteraceae bacterium]|nr:HAD-IIB family hydrolase [Desulfobacteraceae bacterium]
MIPGMFITDLDGTLLRDDKRLADSDISALEALGARGITRVVATGRSWDSFREIMEKLGFMGPGRVLPVDYVIFSTGAGIMAFPQADLIQQYALDPSEVDRITTYFEGQGLDYMVHKPIPRTREFVFRSHGRSNPDFWSRIELYRHCASVMEPGKINGFGRATQVLAIVPKNEAPGVVSRARQALTGLSVIKATSPLDNRSVWIEVFPRSVSKSQAASWLGKRLGADPANVVALGNDYNDLDLLDWAGYGFVVDNAPADLKSRFRTVCSNNRCGVARAIFEVWGRGEKLMLA